MLDVSIAHDDARLRAAIRKLEALPAKAGRGMKTALQRIGLRVKGTAQAYCPESPTKGQYVRTLKTRKTKRNDFNPGALRNSITSKLEDESVLIYVPSNSPGGKYAEKIHAERGKTWQHLGPGSKAKNVSGNVGDKFIENAGKDEQKNFEREIQGVIADLIRGFNHGN